VRLGRVTLPADVTRGRIIAKLAPAALRIPLALRERAGVRETVMVAAIYSLGSGADAMTVRL